MEPRQLFRLVGVGLQQFLRTGGPLRPTRLFEQWILSLYNMTAYYQSPLYTVS